MRTEPAVLIVADDLSGAADSAAALAGRADTAVALHAEADWPRSSVIAVDTDSRYLPGPAAAAACAAVIGRAGPETLVYKKIDSTLRGNIGPEIAASLAALSGRDEGIGAGGRHLAVVAPAFPATGRTVVDGSVLVGGEPLRALHPSREPLIGQLEAAGLRVARLPLRELRDGSPEAVLAGTRDADAVVVDALTDEDLARTARACTGLRALLVGSGGLAHHLHPETSASGSGGGGAAAGASGPALVCVGSRSDAARAQLRELLDGTDCVAVRVALVDGALEAAAQQVHSALTHGRHVAVFPDPDEPVDPARSGQVAALLGEVARAGLDAAGTFVATGGETARSALTAGGVNTLAVQGELEPGVVSMRTPGGLRVVTKAGSFGDSGTLLRIVRPLSPPSRHDGPYVSGSSP